jgi:hypothetical protein
MVRKLKHHEQKLLKKVCIPSAFCRRAMLYDIKPQDEMRNLMNGMEC